MRYYYNDFSFDRNAEVRFYNPFSTFLQGIVEQDKDLVINAFNRLLACVAYDDYTSAAKQSISNHRYDMQPQEWLYRSSIFSFLHGCGVVVAAEMHTNTDYTLVRRKTQTRAGWGYEKERQRKEFS